jgi:pilus assembly protein CpaB
MPVVVAARDLDAGALVGDGDVRIVEWPAVEGSHWMSRQSDVVGRAVLTPVARDEPFGDARLAAKGADASLAARIPPGMRVVAVHVDELTGLSRFILAGMHVDVISTGSSGGQNVTARTILQNIQVFSTGQSGDPKAAPLPVFNLLVTPREAEVLSQAVAQSRIELVLRNPLDRGSTLSEVLPEAHLPLPRLTNLFRPKPVEMKPEPEKKVVAVESPPPPPVVPTVEVIQGTKRTVSAVAASDPETRK